MYIKYYDKYNLRSYLAIKLYRWVNLTLKKNWGYILFDKVLYLITIRVSLNNFIPLLEFFSTNLGNNFINFDFLIKILTINIVGAIIGPALIKANLFPTPAEEQDIQTYLANKLGVAVSSIPKMID
jgi:hypothetical protein